MKKSILLAVFFVLVLPFVSSYGVPDESLGDKTIYLEIGKPMIWEKGEIYNLEVKEIKGQEAYFNFIYGEKSIRFSLSKGRSIGLDLNGDSQSDMKIILEEIKSNGVNIKIRSDEVEEEKGNSKDREIFFIVLISVIVLLIIAVVFYAIKYFYKKNKTE